MLYGVLAAIIVFALFRIYRYIRKLQGENNSIRLSSSEKIEYLEARLYDSLYEHRNLTDMTNLDSAEIINEENKKFKEKITSFIHTHISDTGLSVQDIAQEMAMSRSLLYLQTKNILGCTPNNLILDMRMEHAMNLISNPSTNISDIAYTCGFSDPKYFARCFKKATGMTPSEYRRSKN
jgi:AraC-like DNA-binding protein